MASYEVTFSGCIHVDDESSESAIAHVKNYIIDSEHLEFDAEEIGDEDDG